MSGAVAVAIVAGVVAACGGGDDGDGPRDAGAGDGSACTLDHECANGVFCDGVERCVDGICRAPASGPCTGAERCDEAAARCVLSCIAETCNGADDDCDGSIDEELLSAFHADVDGDGYGDPGATTLACEALAGSVEDASDCDDVAADRHPGASERCDSIDQDCDGAIDEDVALLVFHRDADGDGIGADADTITACARPEGYVDGGGDCDDTDATVGPGVTETCNRRDDDCDGSVDEVLDSYLYYRDADRDGRGDPLRTLDLTTCTPPLGFVTVAGDCNDADGAIHTGAAEMCDRIDQDCSLGGALAGSTDDAEDADRDGHAATMAPCSGGFPTDDCDDADPMAYAGAVEMCDGRDTDCSRGGGAEPTEDMDADGYIGSPPTCLGSGDDCDDGDASVHPSAPELCDLIDSDCSAGGGEDYTEDADGDGHASLSGVCSGGPIPRDDCDDADPALWGDGIEHCDGVDTDCDSVPDGAAAASSCAAGTRCVTATCTTVDEVTAGGAFTCARHAGGRVTCWGDNNWGQLGLSSWFSAQFAPIDPVVGLDDAVEIDAGELFACARRASGAVVCWGAGELGELGDGTSEPARLVPSDPVLDLTAVEVTTGSFHACARRADGTVVCWGYDNDGPFPFGTSSWTPWEVAGIAGAAQVRAGSGHTCAIVAGLVRCWGRNTAGQLGDGSTTDSTTPVTVVGVTDVVELALGAAHTCALRTDGAVFCWGDNRNRQLNAALTVTRSLVPIRSDVSLAARGSPPTLITAGDLYTCVGNTSWSDVVCWGSIRGESATLSSVVELEGGGAHACARVDGGGIWCWGSNVSGQIGDGRTRLFNDATEVL